MLIASSLKAKALVVGASSSKFGRTFELLSQSSDNLEVDLSVVISGIRAVVTRKSFNLIAVTVRNEDILNSNLSNLATFDNLTLEIPMTNQLVS